MTTSLPPLTEEIQDACKLVSLEKVDSAEPNITIADAYFLIGESDGYVEISVILGYDLISDGQAYRAKTHTRFYDWSGTAAFEARLSSRSECYFKDSEHYPQKVTEAMYFSLVQISHQLGRQLETFPPFAEQAQQALALSQKAGASHEIDYC
ncbi:hypothetical protein [Marinospirillum sp.]|uniref:hypothetical protein n=1 Tax=Marinospirillum sp. TaxID=2183934 RepID=UPI003A8625B9